MRACVILSSGQKTETELKGMPLLIPPHMLLQTSEWQPNIAFVWLLSTMQLSVNSAVKYSSAPKICKVSWIDV